MKSLAIEREFGSGGREIGKKVAELAGISCYDGSLMAQVAEAKGISLDMLKEYDEKKTGSLWGGLSGVSKAIRRMRRAFSGK